MRFLLLYLLLLLSTTTWAQMKDRLQKSWIKTTVENLTNPGAEPDTLYTRYTFLKSDLMISFYPAWDTYPQTWSVDGTNLTIGFDTYTIEELTDTTLTIMLPAFRRVRFVAEDYVSSKKEYLDSIGTYNGKPLYRANNFITPRYTKKEIFRHRIQKNVEGYHIKNASYFKATFVVTEEGKVENVKVVNSISEGFDREIVNQLLSTSKRWKPAYFDSKPIQTEMFYDIKYLKSVTPYSSGTLQ